MGNGDDDGCPFCQIVEGKLDSHVVKEDGNSLAFLDVNPVSKGHTLVVPKQHADQLTDLGSRETGNLFDTVHEVAQALEDALEPEGLNIIQSNGEAAGQEIAHVHVHVIPRYLDDGLSFSFEQQELEEEEAEEVLGSVQSFL